MGKELNFKQLDVACFKRLDITEELEILVTLQGYAIAKQQGLRVPLAQFAHAVLDKRGELLVSYVLAFGMQVQDVVMRRLAQLGYRSEEIQEQVEQMYKKYSAVFANLCK